MSTEVFAILLLPSSIVAILQVTSFPQMLGIQTPVDIGGKGADGAVRRPENRYAADDQFIDHPDHRFVLPGDELRHFTYIDDAVEASYLQQ